MYEEKVKNTFEEFKKFISKGNIVDLAVGVIIGSAFGKIVSSLVNDVVLPPIGVLLNGVDFKKLSIVVQQAKENTEAVTINYGAFLTTVLDFLIIAWVIFLALKAYMKLKAKFEKPVEPKPEPVPVISDEVKLLTEIRDLLKKN
ncbi:MAG: large-conductance mechanosensitive channel protein MscL [Ignavibacteriaceae bacterium]|nr:large-conductance mechanosensitive channel protein MscL [Ignavibacteriaceae bacterium]